MPGTSRIIKLRGSMSSLQSFSVPQRPYDSDCCKFSRKILRHAAVQHERNLLPHRSLRRRRRPLATHNPAGTLIRFATFPHCIRAGVGKTFRWLTFFFHSMLARIEMRGNLTAAAVLLVIGAVALRLLRPPDETRRSREWFPLVTFLAGPLIGFL